MFFTLPETGKSKRKVMFTERDLAQIEAHGLTVRGVERQLEYFSSGFPFLPVDRAAVPGDGIRCPGPAEVEIYRQYYNDRRGGLRIVKFVPASGAATRMFKSLFAFLEDGTENDEVREVADNAARFAFAEALDEKLAGKNDAAAVIAAIIGPEGLDYGAAPKALIPFHRYPDGARTALEEHLAEGALYAAGNGGEVRIHFTVSPEHRAAFEALVAEAVPRCEARYGVRYNIGYSQQQPATDTIAVTPDNEPFRDADGALVFRPAGHGALLANLGAVDADLIFVKNIDNVTTDSRKGDTVTYKEALAGLLLSLQQTAFGLLEELAGAPDADTLDAAARFLTDELGQRLPAALAAKTHAEKVVWLTDRLDRPMRVCGMVKNEGEPGGGPCWVRNRDGGCSLQIVEPPQVAPDQQGALRDGTHFNPVDLVCATRGRHGEAFDLARFSDPETGFISEKSKSGRPLRAQELPGLWNGAMAGWNTVFVEVPVSVFTPVKTINDLLRPEHQA